jgi:hypothetical protein
VSYFPSAPLPVRVFIAPGYDPTSPTSWTWTEITSDVRFSTGVSIEAGRRDEGSHADPSKCTLVLNNRAGNYSTRNALGAYYGDLRRNTPLAVRVDRLADTFTRTSASGWGTSDSGFVWAHTSTSTWTVDGSQGVSTFAAANSSAIAVNGTGGGLDVDVEFVASIGARTTGSAWVTSAILRYADVNNFYLVGIEFATDNTIKVSCHKYVAGAFSTIVGATATGISYSANTKIRVRAVASGANLQVKAWLDGGTEPSDWNAETQDTDNLTGSAVGIFQWRESGNTNVGSLAVKLDSYTCSAILFTGLVSEWPVRWNKVGTDSVVQVTANGITRRLQQGATPVHSPLYRQLIAQSPAGYWPGEDDSGATQVGTPLAGQLAARVSDVSFASASDLPGSDPVMVVNSTAGWITGGILASPLNSAGYAAMVLVKLGSLPAAATNVIEWYGSGSVYRWVIDADATSFGLTGYDSGDTVVVARTAALFVVDPTRWTAIQLETNVSGGTVTWSLIWNQIGDATFYAMTDSYAGTATRIVSFRVVQPTASSGYAHIWAGPNTLPFVSTAFSLVSSGYVGETAADRITRLCDEEGIAVLIEPSGVSSEAMGVQRTGTIMTLLQAAQDADMGILYERGGGLAYRPRSARYNADVDIALDVDSGHLAEAPEPTDDDQRVRNDVTVARDLGGKGRATDLASIAEVGTYAEQVTLSLSADARCDDQASWRVYLGTLPELRWPRLDLNFGRNPALIDDWLGCTLGARITVANPPDQLLGEEIDLIVEGYAMRLSPVSWTVALTCSPALPWQVGVLGTAMVDTAGSELTSNITSSATSFSVDTTTGPVWSTSGTDFDILVGGERMTCTNITGSSSPQTFTVTRAVNGVVKAHDAGTAVNVYRPLVVAL